MAHDVFISHSSKDKAVADAVCAVLEEKGIRCWVAPRDIRPGADFAAAIIDALRDCRVMVLIFSGHANQSPQIKREVNRAVDRGIPIIPFRIENILPTGAMEYAISAAHWLDAFSLPLENYLETLARVVREILDMPEPASAPDPDAPPTPLPVPRAPLPRPSPPPRKSRVLLIAVGLLLFAMVAGLGWYFEIERPAGQEQERQAQIAQQEAIEKAKELGAQQAAAAEALLAQQAKAKEEADRQAEARGGVMVKTDPPGATVALGGEDVQTSPALFKSLKLGKYPVHITLDGYEPIDQEVEVTENHFADLGTVSLVHSKGTLQITTDANLVYTISQGGNTVKTGVTPATIADLPTGDYDVTVAKGDWEIKNTVTVKRNETATCAPAFATGSLAITSDPSGASVLQGDKELGTTPLVLKDLRTGEVSFTLKLKGYAKAGLNGTVVAKQQTSLSAKLDPQKGPQPGENFTAGNGMEMVWVAPMHGWVGKYLVTQAEYENVAGDNPSNFKGATRPVEMVSWNEAMAYCQKLTHSDNASGILPANYRYSLPSDGQYNVFVGDASLDDAVTGLGVTRSSTEPVGSKGANGYGLYDTRGNVWEWCLEWYSNAMNDSGVVAKYNIDDGGGGKYKVLRGGSWGNNDAQILALGIRSVSAPDGRQNYFGFRCVLVGATGG